MAFADWMKRSKIFTATQRRLNSYSPITELCRAAYKAGERDGRKQVEAVATNAVGFAVLVEREACAKVCESATDTGDDSGIERDVATWNRAIAYCVRRIKERSNAADQVRPARRQLMKPQASDPARLERRVR